MFGLTRTVVFPSCHKTHTLIHTRTHTCARGNPRTVPPSVTAQHYCSVMNTHAHPFMWVGNIITKADSTHAQTQQIVVDVINNY